MVRAAGVESHEYCLQLGQSREFLDFTLFWNSKNHQ
jgi:hypothetical protein